MPSLVAPAVADRGHERHPHDGSRAHAEARTVYPSDEGDGVAASRFSERDITSGLPDDSREADEREEERRLRDPRGRLKAGRAVVARTPGLAEPPQRDWRGGGQVPGVL